jgi:hypothetical protein
MAAIERSDSIAALRRKADSRLTGVWVAFAGLGFNVTRATGHPRIAVDLAMAALAGLAANVAQRLIRRGGRRFESMRVPAFWGAEEPQRERVLRVLREPEAAHSEVDRELAADLARLRLARPFALPWTALAAWAVLAVPCIVLPAVAAPVEATVIVACLLAAMTATLRSASRRRSAQCRMMLRNQLPGTSAGHDVGSQ